VSLKIELQPNETLIFEDGVQGAKKPMVLGVTDQAVFFTKEQHFAKESWRLERIPIPTITQVYIEKEKKMVPWVIAIIVFTFGLVSELAIAWNVYRELPGTKSRLGP
jgi:hypothetical protein